MSPWLTATQTAVGPCAASTSASMRRIAATARDCMVCMDSPPGNTTALGFACTVRHSGSFARSASFRPCHCP